QHKLLTASGVVLFALVLLVALWDWNWFRPLVARKIAAEIDRSVSLAHFDIKDLFTRHPLIVLDGIAVGNPPDFPNGSQLGTIGRLSLRVDLPAALKSGGSDIVISEIAIERPQGDLRPGPSGNPNWAFNLPASNGPSNPPKIGSLVITEGDFHIA